MLNVLFYKQSPSNFAQQQSYNAYKMNEGRHLDSTAILQCIEDEWRQTPRLLTEEDTYNHYINP